MRSYLDEFLSLRCAPDVLEAVHPLRRPEKEISESMALVAAVRGRLLASTLTPTLLDLCAGNALMGIIAAHLFAKLGRVVAVDKRQHFRVGFSAVKSFEYRQGDITLAEFWSSVPADAIVVASHACGKLSEMIVENCASLYLPMAIIPCCLQRSRLPEWTNGIAKEKGKYFAWLSYLAQKAGGKFRIDSKCLSPCNGVVTRGL